MNLIILGAPGSGKGTQAQALAEKLKLRHVSTGELLREAVAKKTEIGKQVESVITKGDLVSDELVMQLIEPAVTEFKPDDPWEGWILDGFPRNGKQADALEDLLSSKRVTVEGVIVLEVDPEVVVDRLAKRGRDDDTPETVRNRLEVYEAETRPILDLYEQRYDVYYVDGSQSIGDVTEEILGLLT